MIGLELRTVCSFPLHNWLQGDGYINIAISQKTLVPTPTVTQFYLIREHRLHGIVTGIEGIKTVSSLDDNLDRLLVSFKDAKVRPCLPKHIHHQLKLLRA